MLGYKGGRREKWEEGRDVLQNERIMGFLEIHSSLIGLIRDGKTNWRCRASNPGPFIYVTVTREVLCCLCKRGRGVMGGGGG